MTDFDKLFMVKINKVIKKKTERIFLVAYVTYGSLVYTDNTKIVLFTPLTAGSMPYNYGTFKK